MDRIIETLVFEYMGPIFYFSLKKTSDRYSAEELTQEILLEVISSLHRGSKPENMRAWIWKIARNRYARRFARGDAGVTCVDIDEYAQILSDEEDPTDNILRDEEYDLLYRELSLLQSDYGRIVAAYYFENKSISEISAYVRLPHGTVKRKLYECRKNLKEGMKMARTYGKRSFAPENITFLQNWRTETGPSGRRYVERIISQNILLEAYDNPSSTEELSLALGIARPYMEEEIGLLLEGALLICDKGRYLTNIVILSKTAQDNLYKLKTDISKKLSPLIIKATDEIGRKEGLPDNQSFNDMKMSLIVMYLDRVCASTTKPDKLINDGYVKHKDGGEWALMGYEKTDMVIPTTQLSVYKRNGQVITPPFHGANKRALDLNNAHVPIFSKDRQNQLLTVSTDDEVINLLNDYYNKAQEILLGDIPKYLYGKAMVSLDADQFRTKVLEFALKTGYITLPEDMNKSAVGVWLYE